MGELAVSATTPMVGSPGAVAYVGSTASPSIDHGARPGARHAGNPLPRHSFSHAAG